MVQHVPGAPHPSMLGMFWRRAGFSDDIGISKPLGEGIREARGLQGWGAAHFVGRSPKVVG